MKMSLSIKEKIKKISQNPGIYIFKNKSGQILYIGKATNLKSRVGSYFNNSQKENRPVMTILDQVEKVETQVTESVLEALILEANLIKKHQPKYNVDLKDDKSFSYAVVTREDFPRLLVVRETELEKDVIARKEMTKQSQKDANKTRSLRYARDDRYTAIFGPYTSKKQLEMALKIIRRIFPYHVRKEKSEKGCLNFQLGLCPGPYEGAITKKDYQKNIRNVRMILRGQKKSLLKKLEKEMKEYSENLDFEKAGELRNKIFALSHIQDVALISKETQLKKKQKIRIEAYDISNISGQQAVGSMIVFEGGELKKSEYRKFRIKNVAGADDVGMMAEVLFRRFGNNWPKPSVVLLDGGKGHLNMAEKIFQELKIKIPLVAVSKGPTRKVVDFQFILSRAFPLSKEQKKILTDKNFIGRLIEEAHRFAINYHRNLRKKEFLKK